MKRQTVRPYQSLQDWMERTGTNQTELRRLVYDRTGLSISKGHMSSILTGRFRCSLQKAIALHRVTGVPVEKLVKWPRDSRVKTFEQVA
jgi:hypothetical protein